MNMYTVKELSLALQKHEETIKRWLRSGKFPNAFRNSDKEGWRIPESDLVRIKQGTGFVKEDSQQNQQVIRDEVEESELVKLAYEVVTLTSPTQEIFTLLSVVGIKRTLEILLIMQQSATKVKTPMGLLRKPFERIGVQRLFLSNYQKQSKHIYDFNQLDYEAKANKEQHEYQPKIPFFNWLEE